MEDGDGRGDVQCVNHLVMRAVEEELVNDSVDAYGSADKFEV